MISHGHKGADSFVGDLAILDKDLKDMIQDIDRGRDDCLKIENEN